MAFLPAILTHLGQELVGKQLDYLRAVAPESRFAVCFGGPCSEFERLASPDALFIDEPSLSWRPEYGAEDAIAAKRAGRAFLHPFKQLESLDAVRRA